MIHADLHFHTCYSSDATNLPKQIVERLNTHPTIKAIAITDHNTLEGYRKTSELAKTYPDILIIPGVEISAEEGEIILLGIEKLPPEPWTARNVITYAKANNALAIASHPYRGYGLGDRVLQLDLDAIEILNGITPPNQNRKAEKLAEAKGLPGTAGSDAHFPTDPWNVYTEIQATLDLDEVLDAIKKGKVTVSFTEKSIHF
ncbi:MAG TPA: PHP domain-containing protein [Candidatus Bathyarchaeia archaeon]|nr:PHP domain-containing protein [Candidatus Bathyarchaeia archaeon]